MEKARRRTRRRIRLAESHLEHWANLANLKTVEEMARFTGTDPSQFRRIIKGKVGAGAVFVDRVISAPWPSPRRLEFEDFFEFVDVA